MNNAQLVFCKPCIFELKWLTYLLTSLPGFDSSAMPRMIKSENIRVAVPYSQLAILSAPRQNRKLDRKVLSMLLTIDNE
jgi:hypothetical protein